jgi:hypothetical protein
MAINVVCDCGKEFKVKDDLAGKKIKCPACQSVLGVPAAGEDVAAAPSPSAGKRVVADEDVAAGPPRKRAGHGQEPKSRTMLFALIGGGVLLLGCCCLGVGVGGFFLFFLGKTRTPPFEEKDRWTASDPLYKLAGPGGEVKVPHKSYMVTLKAKKTYTIDLTAPGKTAPPDPYLVIEDKNGKKLAEDDDSGGFPNARIVFTPDTDGDYKIIAATIKGTGDFTLSVKEVGGGKEGGGTGGSPEKVIVGKWKIDFEESKKILPESEKGGFEIAAPSLTSMTYQFNADNTLVASIGNVSIKGKWKAIGTTANTITLEVTAETKKEPAQLTITVVNNDRLRIMEIRNKGTKELVWQRI